MCINWLSKKINKSKAKVKCLEKNKDWWYDGENGEKNIAAIVTLSKTVLAAFSLGRLLYISPSSFSKQYAKGGVADGEELPLLASL